MQGRGLVQLCVKALISVAKAEGYNKILIECDTNNEKSKSVAKRLGFHYLGDLESDGGASSDDEENSEEAASMNEKQFTSTFVLDLNK